MGAYKEETLEKYPQLSWDNLGWKITNEQNFFQPSCTWTFVSSGTFGVRVSLGGAIFDVGGSSAFPDEKDLWVVAGFLCSKLAFDFLKLSNPTLNFQVANVNSLPWIRPAEHNEISETVRNLVQISKRDWDAVETSWDFESLPLISSQSSNSIKASYVELCRINEDLILEVKNYEEKNNELFIEAYGLVGEVDPEVPLDRVTLACNPHYRFSGQRTDDELRSELQSETMQELSAYAIGCMMGRYSLDMILPSNDGHLKNVIHCNEVNHGKIDDINEEKILYPLLRYLSARSVSAC